MKEGKGKQIDEPDFKGSTSRLNKLGAKKGRGNP